MPPKSAPVPQRRIGTRGAGTADDILGALLRLIGGKHGSDLGGGDVGY